MSSIMKVPDLLIFICIFLAGCAPKEAAFFYVDLESFKQIGRKMPGLEGYTGKDLPVYEVVFQGETIRIADDGFDRFTPGLRIFKQLRGKTLTLVDHQELNNIMQTSPFSGWVLFIGALPGETVSVEIQINGHDELLVVEGIVKSSGSFRFWDAL